MTASWITRALGRWGAPPDAVAWCALALAAVVALRAMRANGFVNGRFTRVWRVALSVFAAWMSGLWWRHYLGGAPKIIDATTYHLQARAIARGALTWALPGEAGSFAGRFVLVGAHGRAGGIFPQGAPALFSVGEALGAPWVTGCALAGGLVWATGALAAQMEDDRSRRDGAQIVAMALSATCAALRFHTSETMSHGAAALALTLALLSALRGSALASGLCLGWLVTIRPVSALAVGLVCACVIARERGVRGLAALCVGALPGVAAHVAAQHAVTGRWWASTQRAYYEATDRPPGCFRYGFGRGVGCRVEHGAYLDAHMPRGYGLWEALGVTARRLRAHAMDLANVELLALASVWMLARTRRSRAMTWGLATVALHMLAYAPFYFDGNIPGGGARMFAELLPVEHAVIAVALSRRGLRAALTFAAASLAGFALHASHSHAELRALPDHGAFALERAHITRGLVFAEDDHAYGLLYVPGVDVRAGVVVAILHGDARDARAWEALGRPRSWVLRRDGTIVAWRVSAAPR